MVRDCAGADGAGPGVAVSLDRTFVSEDWNDTVSRVCESADAISSRRLPSFTLLQIQTPPARTTIATAVITMPRDDDDSA